MTKIIGLNLAETKAVVGGSIRYSDLAIPAVSPSQYQPLTMLPAPTVLKR